MSSNLSKYVAAAALAGAVAFGGYSIAGAQDDGSTTTEVPEAEAPSTDAERPRRENCPEKDGSADSSTDDSTAESSFSTT